MRPLPTLWFPSPSFPAPLAFGWAVKFLFIGGFIFFQGDQAPHLWRSLMSGKIFSGGALMLAERLTWNVSGLVAAKTRRATIRTTNTRAMILNIDPSGAVLTPCSLG